MVINHGPDVAPYLKLAWKHINAGTDPTNEVQTAALNIANDSLKAGLSKESSIEKALSLLHGHIPDANAKAELRVWLRSALGPQQGESGEFSNETSTMRTNRWKRDLVAVSLGLIIGVVLAALAARFVFRSDDFAIHIMNRGIALKINNRTGQTWKLEDGEAVWLPVRNASER
jgi:hypothetical protein